MLPSRVIPIRKAKGRNRVRVSEGATTRWVPRRNAFGKAVSATTGAMPNLAAVTLSSWSADWDHAASIPVRVT